MNCDLKQASDTSLMDLNFSLDRIKSMSESTLINKSEFKAAQSKNQNVNCPFGKLIPFYLGEPMSNFTFSKAQEACIKAYANGEFEQSNFTFNKAQEACIKAYANGEFEHFNEIKSPEEYKNALNSCGDTLFKFLMIELSTSEDCDSVKTAIERIYRAIDDILAVKNKITYLPEDLSWGDSQDCMVTSKISRIAP